jgi:hypothetical protein
VAWAPHGRRKRSRGQPLACSRQGRQVAGHLRRSHSWATVVFHNTDAAVWQAIRDAADESGFTFHEASSLERQQQSHKGYKGRSGSEDVAHFDVVFNLHKTSVATQSKLRRTKTPQLDLSKMVASIVKDRKIAQHGLQGIHAEVMRRMASKGSSTFVDYAEIRVIWERLVTRENAPLQAG